MGLTFHRNSRFEAAPLNEEAILFDPETSNFFMLNRTSSFIWDRLASPGNAETLAADICEAFGDVDLATALSDVHKALEQMLKMELVVATD